MTGADRDKALREAAANRGLKLVKSRRRSPGVGDYGRYGLTDAAGAELLGFGKSGLTATADEIEAYFHKGLVSDWKSSLGAAGGKPRRGPKSRPELEPAPEPPPPPPEPTPLTFREARAADAAALAQLLAQVGREAAESNLSRRLAALAEAGEPPLLAVRDRVVGCLVYHRIPTLEEEAPLARLTLLLVDKEERRRGIGRSLVEAALRKLSARGCGGLEAPAPDDLNAAAALRKLGFDRAGYLLNLPVTEPKG
ncbi:MAG TPA: GNAT family N-acetyltransferase [Allosphingosinicella sp.]|jgi:GNAT superfamily N-acetyltransferase